jgi:hypothetical protein
MITIPHPVHLRFDTRTAQTVCGCRAWRAPGSSDAALIERARLPTRSRHPPRRTRQQAAARCSDPCSRTYSRRGVVGRFEPATRTDRGRSSDQLANGRGSAWSSLRALAAEPTRSCPQRIQEPRSQRAGDERADLSGTRRRAVYSSARRRGCPSRGGQKAAGSSGLAKGHGSVDRATEGFWTDASVIAPPTPGRTPSDKRVAVNRHRRYARALVLLRVSPANRDKRTADGRT